MTLFISDGGFRFSFYNELGKDRDKLIKSVNVYLIVILCLIAQSLEFFSEDNVERSFKGFILDAEVELLTLSDKSANCT